MLVPTSQILLGMLIGAVAGLVLGQVDPGASISAMASDAIDPHAGKALDDTRLVKFNGDYFAVNTEPGVSLDPVSQVQVRKIGYGRTSLVNILTTSSGTYSSEGMVSPHIRYPGIHTERLQLAFLPSGTIAGWSRLTGWVNIPLLTSNSFGFLDSYSPPASAGGVCVTSNEDGACR